MGGKIPFGYRVDARRGLVRHSKEQAVIADLKRLVGQMSIRKATKRVVEQHGIRLSHETAAKIVRTVQV